MCSSLNQIYLKLKNYNFNNLNNFNNKLNTKYARSQDEQVKTFEIIYNKYKKHFALNKKNFIKDIGLICFYDLIFLCRIIKEINYFTKNFKNKEIIINTNKEVNSKLYIKGLLDDYIKINKLTKLSFVTSNRDKLKNIYFRIINFKTTFIEKKNICFSLKKPDKFIKKTFEALNYKILYFNYKNLLQSNLYIKKRSRELSNEIDSFFLGIEKVYNLKFNQNYTKFKEVFKENFNFWLNKYNFFEKNNTIKYPFVHWQYGNTATRLIGVLFKRKNLISRGISHADYGIFSSPKWLYESTEASISNEVLALNKKQAKFYTLLKANKKKIYNVPKIKIVKDVFKINIIYRKNKNQKKVLIKGYPFGNPQSIYRGYDNQFINLNLEMKLFQLFNKHKIDFAYKIHPDKINENYKFFKKICPIETENFDKILHKYDTVVFPTPFTSLLFETIFHDINIVTGFYNNKFSEYLQNLNTLKKRMHVFIYDINKNFIPQFDEEFIVKNIFKKINFCKKDLYEIFN